MFVIINLMSLNHRNMLPLSVNKRNKSKIVYTFDYKEQLTKSK